MNDEYFIELYDRDRDTWAPVTWDSGRPRPYASWASVKTAWRRSRYNASTARIVRVALGTGEREIMRA